MEPVYSMSAYAVVVTASLAALAGRGFPGSAAGIALGIFAIGAALEASYLLRREGDRALPHRRRLDNVVRAQWIGVGVLGFAAAGVLGGIADPPLADAAVAWQALVIAVVATSATVFVSSLFDWYWILPKVSGMVDPAPCVRVGGEGFAGVTKVWYFHRAAATTVVTAALVGVPGYIAGEIGSGRDSAALAILGSALGIGYYAVSGRLTTAFRFAFNPPGHVGDIICVRARARDDRLKEAYVVDVSIQGLKYKLLELLDRDEPCFRSKGKLVRIEDVEDVEWLDDAEPPCPHVAECRAANWYCFRNPNANAPGERAVEPVPWPASEEASAGATTGQP